MAKRFDQQVVWITGGGTGIGRAMAEQLAQEGALVVVSGVIGMIVMLVFGLMGEEVMLIGSGLINSAVNAVVIVLMLGVLAAVHRQLAGPSAESMGETFE